VEHGNREGKEITAALINSQRTFIERRIRYIAKHNLEGEFLESCKEKKLGAAAYRTLKKDNVRGTNDEQ